MPTQPLMDLRERSVKHGDLILLIEPDPEVLAINKAVWTVARFAGYNGDNHSFIALPDTIHYFCPPTNYLALPTPMVQQVPASARHTLPTRAKRIEVRNKAVLRAFDENPHMRLYAQFMRGTPPTPEPDYS